MTAAARAEARTPPSGGQPLTESDYATLAASWITRDIADAAMLRRVDEHEGREIVGQKGKRDCAGILIPNYWPGESWPRTYRLRRDNPDWRQGKDGKITLVAKYLAPLGDGNRFYIPLGITVEQLQDVKIPIVIVEGEKKALALLRLAHHDTDQLRFVSIAISGVWNWNGTIGKTGGPKGERLDVKGPIFDIGRIPWIGRQVYIVFDTNVHTNDSVKRARKGISRELATRRAEVQLVTLPEDCRVNGIDDLLATWGPDRVLKLFDEATSGAHLQVVLPPQFQSKPEGMFRTAGREQLSQVQLTNYNAAITTNIQLDDGVERKREFEITAELLGRKSRITIPAAEFARMDWPIEHLGSGAITFPNQKEYARTAIQSFSMTAEERCIYTHTGWREIDGQRVFLHASGAIGGAGAVSGVNVRLAGAISHFGLRLPGSSDALKAAVRASLKLADLGPPAISLPLLAATYRAVLGDADFALHLVGETGAFKSEVAALHQQHFGAGMDRLHLPGAWSSTANALESVAFHAKDTLFVIDDFAPQGSGTDVARYHAAAERVFRAAGNHAGRSRLDSSARLREAKPPRALILSTGEEVPRGQSVRARLLILELSKNRIDLGALSARQNEARAGLYAEAMSAFIQWLATRSEDTRAWFNQRVSEYRGRALHNTAHARTPDILANLQAGFELLLEFAVDSGALDGGERDCLAKRCWDALGEAAAAQSQHQQETEPTALFLATLRSGLSSGRAHLAARDGGPPDRAPESCGWRRDNSGNLTSYGDCIGWVHEDNLYLDPTAAYRVVQVAARDSGETLAVSVHTLKKRLQEKGVLASVDPKRETLTVRRSISGASKAVLHFRRLTLLPEVSDGDEDAL